MEAIQDIIETPVPQPELDSFEAYEAAKVAPKVEDEKTAADAEKPTEPPVKLETPGDSEEKAGKPKRDRTAEGRIAELTNQLKAQKEEFERWKAQQATPAAPAAAQVDKKPEATNGRPLLKDFVNALKADETYEDAQERWNDAVQDWREAQAAKRAEESAHAKRSQEMQDKVQTKVQAAMEKFEDFNDIMTRQIPASMVPAIQDFMEEFDTLDALHAVLSDPAEIQRISQLSKARQLVELGKIDDRLSKPEPKPTAPPVSKAPAPIRNIGGSASEANDDITQAKSLEEYERMREKQRKRG
jgi:hypothetical protein